MNVSKIMFDCDGVLVHFARPFHQWVLEHLDDTVPEPTHTLFDFFTHEWKWTSSQVSEAMAAFTAADGWLDLPIYPEVVEPVTTLLDDGVPIEFVTARPALAKANTIESLATIFGDPSRWTCKLEPTPKIGGHRYLASFDDYPANVESLAGTGCPNAMLVAREWNRDNTDLTRCDDHQILAAVEHALTARAA